MKALQQYPLWLYHAEIAQVVAAPNPIGIKIAPKSGVRFKIIAGRTIVNGVLGAARNCAVYVYDENDDDVEIYEYGNLDSNQMTEWMGIRTFANTITGNTAQNLGGISSEDFWIKSPDYLALKVASAANLEKFQLKIRALIDGGAQALANLFSITAIGAGVAITETYNKIL